MQVVIELFKTFIDNVKTFIDSVKTFIDSVKISDYRKGKHASTMQNYVIYF